MKQEIYIIKRPSGSYEDYKEPIEKCFFNKDNANKYVENENKKLPLVQAEKCRLCPFMSYNFASKYKEKPNCCDWDKYQTCQNYFKYFDIYPLEIEEHNIEDLHDHDKELVGKVLERVKTFVRENTYFTNVEENRDDIITSIAYNQALRDFLDFFVTLQKEFEDE